MGFEKLLQRMERDKNKLILQSELEAHARDVDLVAGLNGTYPVSSDQLDGLSAKYKAVILREQLKLSFPSVIFSVKSGRSTHTPTLDVGYHDGPARVRVQDVVGVYSHTRYEGDPRLDRSIVDCFAHTHRSISDMFMQRQMDLIGNDNPDFNDVQRRYHANQALIHLDLPIAKEKYQEEL